jgi:hypothetical protein
MPEAGDCGIARTVPALADIHDSRERHAVALSRLLEGIMGVTAASLSDRQSVSFAISAFTLLHPGERAPGVL